MLVRAPHSFLLILAVCCWFRHNAAVPLAFYPSNQMQDAFEEEKTNSQINSDDTSLDSRFKRDAESSDDTSDEDDENNDSEENDEDDENDEYDDDDEVKNKVSNINWNVNKNINRANRLRNTRHRDTNNRKRHKQNISEDITPDITDRAVEEMAREEASTNCVSSSKKNQRYSSSFYGNTTDQALTVDKEFHDVVGNNSKVKKSSSVHDGEDITLCWIETTTIKEDKTVRPPKRLVIREYTISFENSATIPERYLECKRYEGELTANDPEIGKTALFEVIDEDTMVSRIVNFTSVSHIANITVWQHKKVKCGVGPVVSKNIVELNDGSKNPKKRVEIRVSPKMHQLMATTTDEEPCTDSSTEQTAELSCENGVCETSTIPSIISKNEVGITEETITKLRSDIESESEEEYSLSTVTKLLPEEVSRRSTTVPKLSTTVQEKTDCEENSLDPACLMQKHDTVSSREFPDVSVASTTEVGRERKRVTSDLVTETPSIIVTDYSMETSEIYAPHPIEDRASVAEDSTVSSEVSYEIKERSEEDQSFIELSREQVDKVPPSSTEVITSAEVEPDVTTEISEFTKESSTENVTETVQTEIIEFLSKSEEIPSGQLQTTSVRIKTSSEEEESVPKTISTLPTNIEPKSSIISDEVGYSCENSEACAYSTSSEACDESGKCGKTTKCDSEGCFVEEVTGDQSKFDMSSPSVVTKVSPPTTGSQLSEQSTEMTETQYTTVANVATIISRTSQEIENLTAVNIPIMIAETRRSTTTSTPRHKLTLRFKVLLEHINENKEKQNLVEIEKHLALDENPGNHNNPDLLEQLKFLNDSVNVETISALLNCISLGNLTKNSNFKELDADNDSREMELSNSAPENSISEQFASADAKNDYSEYEEHEVSSRRRRRRSLDNEMEELNRFVKRNLYHPTDSAVDSLNVTQSQTELIKDFELSTTTNHSEEETTTENLRNVITEEGENTMSIIGRGGYDLSNASTTISIIGRGGYDLSNASDSYNTNLTEDTQLTTTTINPEEENSTISIESEKNITTRINNEKNETVVNRALTEENISNGTKMEVVQKTLSGIQEDVVVGLQHIVSQLEHDNMTTLNNVKETIKTGLLDILAAPKEIHLRRRRAAIEEVGHWSNERIKEAPAGGNFRSLTEFTLYKVVS